ncbi:MAG: hypothetical protein ACP5D5_03790 [Acidithiobacillus sp.]|uniref:hypothetical protein n=1 Tax=Acidithiobacillus sp. TaxID=1872118 RepID=UPI003D088DCC
MSIVALRMIFHLGGKLARPGGKALPLSALGTGKSERALLHSRNVIGAGFA